MLMKIRRSTLTAVAVGALGLGGAAVAGAADKSTSSSSGSSQAHPQRAALAADVAAKVKAAALARVPGATVLRTEAGGPNGAAYHAHIRTSGGTLEVVLVDDAFAATGVQADRRGGGSAGGRHGG